MNYPKSLFFNFLAIFFANHILPGIDVMSATKLPHLGADIPFAAALGLLNSLIYPVLKMINHHVGAMRIVLVALVLNFAVYAILKVAPIGIEITSIQGYLFASLLVAFSGFTTNYLYMKHAQHVYQHHNHSGDSEK